MNLQIHIFSTGTELTVGKSTDTNSTWIANELTGLGFQVAKFVVLPDRPELIESEIRFIMESDGENLIIMTGGLGATADDYTLEVACKIAETEPVTDEKALSKLIFFAKSRGKAYEDLLPMSKRQTTYPASAALLENEMGLACGFYLSLNKTTKIAAMPGVPLEMKKMFTNKLLPLIKKDYQSDNWTGISHIIWAMGEVIYQETFIKKHNDFILQNGIEWGVTAKAGHIKVTFRCREEAPLAQINKWIEEDYQQLIGDRVQEDIHEILTKTGKTLATVESCTGGYIAKTITDIPGASSYYLGSIVSYANEIKEKFVGVKRETLDAFGAVSEETAREMAEGIQKQFGTDYAISVTGIAGPGGGTKEKKVGLVYIGIRTPAETIIHKYELTMGRELFREYVTAIALFHLYKKLTAENL